MLATEAEIRGSSGVIRYIAEFNRLTGAFITLHLWHENWALNQQYSKYLEVEFDPTTHGHMGDYDTFQILPLEEIPIVEVESQVDAVASGQIEKAFSVGHQLNVLMDAIQIIADTVGAQVPELTEMREQIIEIRERNIRHKEALAASPEHVFLTWAEEQRILSEQMEGGMYEALGPRTSTGL
jgi:hypothetical protein